MCQGEERHWTRRAYGTRKKYQPEQVVNLLRQIEVAVANGKTTPQACKDAGIVERTYCRWRWQQASLSPQRGGRSLSLERFRTSTKYANRPAAADIAFCVAAFANGMTDDRIERALEDDYLSRDPSPSTRAAYIRRTMAKARDWAVR